MRRGLIFVAALAVAVACSDEASDLDAGEITDAGVVDSGADDAGSPPEDASTFGLSDGGTPAPIRGHDTRRAALDWWVERLEARAPLTRDEIETYLGAGFSDGGALNEFMLFWAERMTPLVGPISVVEDSAASTITAVYDTPNPLTQLQIRLTTITDIGSRAQIDAIRHDRIEPALDPDDVEVFVYGFTPSTTDLGATVELVDPARLQPLDPPVRDVVDQLRRVRLTVPAGTEAFAILALHPDGTPTITVDANLRRGGVAFVPVLEEWSFGQARSRADIEVVRAPGTAQVRLVIQHRAADGTLSPVGCATAESSPPTRIYYGEPGGLPTPFTRETARESGLGWLYDLAPGAYTFTARAGRSEVSAQAELQADTIHEVRLSFTGPDNPTPAECP